MKSKKANPASAKKLGGGKVLKKSTTMNLPVRELQPQHIEHSMSSVMDNLSDAMSNEDDPPQLSLGNLITQSQNHTEDPGTFAHKREHVSDLDS